MSRGIFQLIKAKQTSEISRKLSEDVFYCSGYTLTSCTHYFTCENNFSLYFGATHNVTIQGYLIIHLGHSKHNHVSSLKDKLYFSFVVSVFKLFKY